MLRLKPVRLPSAGADFENSLRDVADRMKTGDLLAFEGFGKKRARERNYAIATEKAKASERLRKKIKSSLNISHSLNCHHSIQDSHQQ